MMGTRLVNVIKYLTCKVFLLWHYRQGSSTKAKKTYSPHDVRLTTLGTNAVFQCLGEKCKIYLKSVKFTNKIYIYNIVTNPNQLIDNMQFGWKLNIFDFKILVKT